jgi:hypothetical protein
MQFYIFKIRTSKVTGNITTVAAHAKGSNTYYWVPRGFVAQLIDKGVTFNTRYKKGDKWVTGAKVEVYEESFLRTVANGTEKDNLESLPTEQV